VSEEGRVRSIERVVVLAVSLVAVGTTSIACGGNDSRTVGVEEVPTDDLIGWYCADYGLEVDDQGRVEHWRDRSSAERHLTTVGTAAQPHRRRSTVDKPPGVSFDGRNDVLRVAGDQRATDALHAVMVVTPKNNTGQFEGLVSAGIAGRSDFETGFNIDLGGREWGYCEPYYPDGLEAFNTLNVESSLSESGCGEDQFRGARPFGMPSVLSVEISGDGESLRVGGRDYRRQALQEGDGRIRVDNLRLGARFYNGRLRGFFRGVITEVLLYDRPLSERSRMVVEAYLREKYGIEESY
jgi:hypothetical protein